MIGNVIAGVAFLVEHDPDIVFHEPNPALELFYTTVKPLADHQVHLKIVNDRMPVIADQFPLFNANNSWFVYQDHQFYWIVLHPPGYETPLWVARMDHGFSDGVVYCGGHLMNSRNNRAVLYNPVSYPLDQIILMYYLAKIGGMIIHSAGWRVNKSGWIFAGKSGAGKSTISSLIVEATDGVFLSDDRIVVRKIGHEYLMYGTPWPGDAGYAVNESVPLKGIFFLSKGEKNSIRKLSPAEAIPRLMPVVSVPWYDWEKVGLMMDFFNDLIAALPMYELTFIPDKAIVRHLLEFIKDPVFNFSS
jgi:hypothetical protein